MMKEVSAEGKHTGRIGWIDTAKGIGILLVAVGHAPRDVMREQYAAIDFLYFFIYTFHMHFFFFLSGLVYGYRDGESRSVKGYFENRIRRLLVPWAFVSMAVYIMVRVMNMIPQIAERLEGTFLEEMPLTGYLVKGLQGNNPYCIHVWYMYVLFFIQGIVFLVQKLYRKITKKETESLWLWVAVEILAVICFLFLPDGVKVMSLVKGYLPFYIGGVLFGKIKKQEDGRLVFSPWMIGGIAVCAVNVLTVDMGMCESAAVRRAVYLATVFAGVPCMIFLLISLSQKIQKAEWFRELGQNSFVIYLLHQPFACAVPATLLTLLLPHNLPVYLGIMLLCIAMSLTLPVLLQRIGYRVGLGRLFEILACERRRGYEYEKC